MAVRPRFPSDRPVLTDNGYISQDWAYYLRVLADQIGQSGTFAVTSNKNIILSVAEGSSVSFLSNGQTLVGDKLHFPSLFGDVTNSGLDISLAEITTPVASQFAKISTDSKGRVTSTSFVTGSDIMSLITATDLTPLLDSYYVNVSGDTMTGNLSVPNLNITSNLTSVDNIQFNVSPAAKLTTPGSLSWNDVDGCLDIVMKGGNVTLQVGQESVQRMVNKSGVSVTDGQAVYVFGAQGNRVSFKLANANSEATSKATLGIVTEPISNNQEGFVTTEGLVRGLDTSAWAEGDVVYLAASDGGLTNVPQTWPNHNVIIGYVVRSHAVVGSIYVKVNNGYEIEELHNVLFTSLATNDLLKFDGSKWVNAVSASKADTLTTARTISLSTDATGSVNFDGSSNVTIPLILASTGVTAGTYKSVTVDVKGRVTAGTNPTTLAGYGITDAMSSSGSFFLGTTNIALNRASGAQSLTGISIDGSAATVTGAAQTAITSLGTLTGLTSSGAVSITNATASTSTTTGALKVSGGVGIVGALYAGALLNAANRQQYYAAYSVAPATNVTINMSSGVNTLTTGYAYKIQAVTTGTSNPTGSYWICYFNGTAWILITVAQNSNAGGSSNYPKLAVSGTNLLLSHNHATGTYTISVTVDAYIHNSLSNFAPSMLGADALFAFEQNTNVITVTNALQSSSNILVSGSSSQMGYATGAGGAVTQLTSKATGVTLNKATGQITLNASALAANTATSFTVTNSLISATDVIDIHRQSGGTALAYQIWIDSVAAGSFVVGVRNTTAGSLSEAIVLNFAVTKAVAA